MNGAAEDREALGIQSFQVMAGSALGGRTRRHSHSGRFIISSSISAIIFITRPEYRPQRVGIIGHFTRLKSVEALLVVFHHVKLSSFSGASA